MCDGEEENLISFEQPFFLLFLLPIPLGLYLRYFWKKRGGCITFSIGTGSRRPFIFQPRQRFFSFLRFLGEAGYWMSVLLLILSLTGVSYVDNRRIFLNRGMDILFVLDESPSMSAKDFPGNRFEAAKQVIAEFIDLRENDAVGLVTFGGQAVMRVPLTMNYSFFKERLEPLQVGRLGDGTAPGRGISLAAAHLKNSGAEERILILLTDGENTDTLISPTAAADAAKELGIRLYTVGIGTEGTVEFEYFKPSEEKIITGSVMSRYDEQVLKALAERTGGRFFPAGSVRSLSESLKKIDSIELMSKSVRIESESVSLTHPLIAAALFCLLFSFLVRKLILKELL